jgi:putative addiction module component (TIGR02574 family)
MEVAMSDQVSELAQRGKELMPEERSRLIDILLESLHEPALAELEAAWDLEIERRLAEYDRGEVRSIDAADVLANARSIAR